MSAIVVQGSRGPNILLRVIYFLLVGWWLGAVASGLAWLLNLTIIGLPLGLYIINRLPSIITLRPQGQNWTVVGNVVVQDTAQRSFLVRTLYFLLIGWWLSGVWISVAYLLLILVVTIPISFWMYGKIGAVTTLYRS